MNILEISKKVNILYRMAAKLNLYFSVCDTQKRERIKEELEAIKKLSEELLSCI